MRPDVSHASESWSLAGTLSESWGCALAWGLFSPALGVSVSTAMGMSWWQTGASSTTVFLSTHPKVLAGLWWPITWVAQGAWHCSLMATWSCQTAWIIVSRSTATSEPQRMMKTDIETNMNRVKTNYCDKSVRVKSVIAAISLEMYNVSFFEYNLQPLPPICFHLIRSCWRRFQNGDSTLFFFIMIITRQA